MHSTINGNEVDLLIDLIEQSPEPNRIIDARFHVIVGDFEGYQPVDAAPTPLWAEIDSFRPGAVIIHVGEFRRYPETVPEYSRTFEAAVQGYHRYFKYPYAIIVEPGVATAAFGPDFLAKEPLSLAVHNAAEPSPSMALMLATLYALVARKQLG
jgi:hypothetical protein